MGITLFTFSGLFAPLQHFAGWLAAMAPRSPRRVVRAAPAPAPAVRCALPARRPLRVLRVVDGCQGPAGAGRMVISGRMADVCAELDRLAPDMLPLRKQVQIACDASKNGVARLSGVEAPKFDDTETTLEQLKERIRKTIDYLDSVPRASLDGCEDKDITFPVGREATRTMKGEAYLLNWALPNLFFHVTTAYAILRHNGVELGKSDYLLGARA